MSAPTVVELHRHLEPVGADTFVADLAQARTPSTPVRPAPSGSRPGAAPALSPLQHR